MPPERTNLPEGQANAGSIQGVGLQGSIGLGKIGYGGSCPPRGKPHHYYSFTIFALDTKLYLKPGCQKEEVLEPKKVTCSPRAE